MDICRPSEFMTSFLVMDILEKASILERQGKHVVHLEIGEPDFDTPECVKEAACRAIHDGKTHYTHSQGLLELRETICAQHYEQFGADISPDQVFVTSGTSPAMLMVFSLLAEENQKIVLTDPHYACYPNFIRYCGLAPEFIPGREEEGFQLKPERVKKRLDGTVAGILVNSPSNPVGSVMPGDDLEALCDLGLPIVSDEIYHGLSYVEKAASACQYTKNAFILNGFSKLYAMTGWRLGYVIVPPKYLKLIQKFQQNFFICAGSVAQWAGLAALTEAQDDVAKMVAEYDARRKYLLERLASIGLVPALEPTGAFYVLVNARHIDGDSLRLAGDILENALVGVTPGIDFGQTAEGYIRFSYANSKENINEGIRRFGEYLKKRGG
ncbi:pyridoxal phosphate-dependent aminotransferase [Desulfovibrio inopinatus]|uniref:pyridoxal phosphate-dependent aminotransferase n=1 Tax=Desulfovibrio inopinatus TaxID=102109 RepID=UPI0004042BB0|nr:pyridoxal phosphate-dependent aminotransferase [Desulfovibrio inopinatus]